MSCLYCTHDSLEFLFPIIDLDDDCGKDRDGLRELGFNAADLSMVLLIRGQLLLRLSYLFNFCLLSIHFISVRCMVFQGSREGASLDL